MVDWLGTGRLRRVENLDGSVFFESAEGLHYTIGSDDGHRIAHVLNHNIDYPNSGSNLGVFNSESEDILDIIDDSWHRRRPEDRVTRNDGRIQYDVPVLEDEFGNLLDYGYIGGAGSGDLATHITVITEADGVSIVTSIPIRK